MFYLLNMVIFPLTFQTAMLSAIIYGAFGYQSASSSPHPQPHPACGDSHAVGGAKGWDQAVCNSCWETWRNLLIISEKIVPKSDDNWLVGGFTILNNMKVNGKDDIPWWKNNTCSSHHQPADMIQNLAPRSPASGCVSRRRFFQVEEGVGCCWRYEAIIHLKRTNTSRRKMPIELKVIFSAMWEVFHAIAKKTILPHQRNRKTKAFARI